MAPPPPPLAPRAEPPLPPPPHPPSAPAHGPGHSAGAARSELLPPLGDEVFAGPPAGRGAARQPALAPTPAPAPAAARPPSPGPAAAPAPAAAHPAGYWIRSIANAIDLVWMSVPVAVATWALGDWRNPSTLVLGVLALQLLALVVAWLGWGLFGATPGKALLGLRVIGGKRRRGLGLVGAFLRTCAVMVSLATLGLGFLMVAFTRDKRGLHDHLAGTAVIRR
jgi:uncharacterized RDD family membrane protein YckC